MTITWKNGRVSKVSRSVETKMQNIENIAINFAPWDDAGCSNKYQILFWSSENLCLGKTSWSCPSKDSSSKTSLSIRYFFENLELKNFLSIKVKPGDNISQGAFHQSARSPTLPWRRYDSRQLDRGYWRKKGQTWIRNTFLNQKNFDFHLWFWNWMMTQIHHTLKK